jgi:hypothetical protein
MVSVKSCAWFNVLKPVFRQPFYSPYLNALLCLRTFVTVYEGILDYHRPAIRGCELLRLAPCLPEAPCVLDMVIRAHAAGYAQDMAG